jgi:hypothetical protein
MRRVAMVLLSITAAAAAYKAVAGVALAADKDKRFAPQAASSYPGHQTANGITIAAVPYTREDETKAAFGKANPYKFGVLPILLVIQNDTGKALRLNLQTELVDLQNDRADPMKPSDVKLWDGVRNKDYRMPMPMPIPLPRHTKGPLDVPEIDGLAFAAKLLPEHSSVHGFYYFDSALRPGAYLYVNGLADAASGKEFLYFEVPFEDQKP